ncbi:MAG TPA: aminotransferase class V-fold PLP-dependent enzyme [Candidatus Limnocylindrales bacterium]
MVSPFLPDAEKVAAVREALPATGAGIYLNTGSVGPLPRETAVAMAELADWELRTGRGSIADLPDTLRRMDEARAAVAAVITADPETIALTHSATDAMNIAAWSIDWKPADRLLTSNLEHAGTLAPLLAVRDRFGVTIETIDIGNGGDDDRTLDAFGRALPGARLVAVSHVAWSTGALLPVARLADLAHAHGAWLAVDGAQSVGAMPVAVGELGADFLAVSGQKWLLGPEGMGALYVGPGALDRARLTFAGWFSYEEGDGLPDSPLFGDARRFESSNYHRPSVVGLARSCSWLSMYVGLDWVYRRGATLARRAADLLAAIPGVEVVTPLERMVTLVSFRIAGWPAGVALEELGRRVFVIARTIPRLDVLRLSVAFFNTESELERVADAVGELAAATPETLAHRPVLTILSGDPG